MRQLKIIFILTIFLFLLSVSKVFAVENPLTVANNKFGIHIISPTIEEASSAAQLVNSTGGDWGYVTIVIQSNDRKKDKWQEFFNVLRRFHLVPIVRLAIYPVTSYWEKPKEEDSKVWADFLDSLVWPTKNRYVVVYNEPNHAQEWGNSADPKEYAQILSQTIDALKQKSEDFFVLNAGLDASAPNSPPEYFDEASFLAEMEKSFPGIFEKLDGWVSHSYPNPGFVGSPTAFGRGSVRTFLWELSTIKTNKHLPVFITETGWKHAEGINYDRYLPTSSTVGEYLKTAFSQPWSDPNIVAVSPFLLSYEEPLFTHFSFKKPANQGSSQDNIAKVLGSESSPYYPQYDTVSNMGKVKGAPAQIFRAELLEGKFYPTLVRGEAYDMPFTFTNTGGAIWNDGVSIKIGMSDPLLGLVIEDVTTQTEIKTEPDGKFTFLVRAKAVKAGNYKVILNLYHDKQEFDNSSHVFDVVIKQPVILKVKAGLLWKDNPQGEYLLNNEKIQIDKSGLSENKEARQLLPDEMYSFALTRPFYKTKTITVKVNSGENLLDFGTLTPDFLRSILKPRELWKVLPFTR